MPYEFAFVKDGDYVNLLEVDRLMCEALGEPVDESRYCRLFLVAQLHSPAMMIDGTITKDGFDRWLEEHRWIFYSDNEVAVARRFLYEEYVFTLWYTR